MPYIILKPNESIRIELFETDGSFTVDYNSNGDSALRVWADMPDSTGRENIIYEELFGHDIVTGPDGVAQVYERAVDAADHLIQAYQDDATWPEPKTPVKSIIGDNDGPWEMTANERMMAEIDPVGYKDPDRNVTMEFPDLAVVDQESRDILEMMRGDGATTAVVITDELLLQVAQLVYDYDPTKDEDGPEVWVVPFSDLEKNYPATFEEVCGRAQEIIEAVLAR